MTQFSIATNEYVGQGKEKAEYHNIVTWDRLAQTCGEFLGKGQQVAIEGRIQTRSWDDDRGVAPLEDRDRRQPRRDAVRAGARRTTRPSRRRTALEAQAARRLRPDATAADRGRGELAVGRGADGDEEDEEDELLEDAVGRLTRDCPPRTGGGVPLPRRRPRAEAARLIGTRNSKNETARIT